MFTGKKIVVGVSGGIAAYKAADIVSWLKKNNAYVQVVMTENATEFISPLVLQTLSNRPVYTDLFATGAGFQVVHIDAAAADLVVVVPATANIMAKMVTGIADEVLSATLLATKAPILIAPAMHADMYNHISTQGNIEVLKSRGVEFIAPATGVLACGAIGEGKLADVAIIEAAIEAKLLGCQDLKGKKVLITAGPTREAIDPVRYITNKSSGKMGYALAKEAMQRGAEVELISGPVNLTPLAGVKMTMVETADEMFKAVDRSFSEVDVLIMSAAVADYRVRQVSDIKMKKANTDLVLDLEENIDILKTMGEKKTSQYLVGFAAETNNVLDYAKEKIRKKNLDLIIANNVSESGAGFDVDTNIITIINSDFNELSLPLMTKTEVACEILDIIVKNI